MARAGAMIRPIAAGGVVALLLLAGCAPSGPRLAGLAPSGAVSGEIVPGGVPVTPEHTLSAGDELEIRLPFAADYNDRVTVGMDGTVAPKSIGSVQVGGLTVAEATERLKQAYAKLLKGPELSVTMRRYSPQIVYVDGWVTRPGLIRSTVPLTVERAIARAGGVKSGARSGGILIIRHDANAGVHPYEVALGPFGGAGGEDPLLKSFDVVYVPQTPIAAVNDFARQFYASVPFSTGYDLTATPAARVIVPQVVAPAPAPAPTPNPR